MAQETSWMKSRIAVGAATLLAAGVLAGGALPVAGVAVADEGAPVVEEPVATSTVAIAIDGTLNDVSGAESQLAMVNEARTEVGRSELVLGDSMLVLRAQERAAELAFDPACTETRLDGTAVQAETETEVVKEVVFSGTGVTVDQLLEELAASKSAYEADPSTDAAKQWAALVGTDGENLAVGVASFTYTNADGSTSTTLVFELGTGTADDTAAAYPTGTASVVVGATVTADLAADRTALTVGDDAAGSTGLYCTLTDMNGAVVRPVDAVTWRSDSGAVTVYGSSATATAAGGAYVSCFIGETCVGGVPLTSEATCTGVGFGDTVSSVETAFEVNCGTPADDVIAMLPTTVNQYWSDGSIVQLLVAWSTADVADDALRVPNATLTVSGEAKDAYGTPFPTTATITVGADYIVSVTEPDVVEAQRGTAGELPQTVTVTWASGATTEEAVQWDCDDSLWSNSSSEPIYVTGWVEGWDEAATLCVVLSDPEPDPIDTPSDDGSDSDNDSDSDGVDGGEVDDGDAALPTDDGLPANDPLTANDGLSGTPSEGDGADASGDAGFLDVDEEPNNEAGDVTPDVTIDGFEELGVIYVLEGTERDKIELPATVNAKLSDGSSASLAVAWSNVDGEPDGSGKLVLLGTVDDTSEQPEQVIQFVTNIELGDRAPMRLGDKFVLPETVDCSYGEDGEPFAVPVEGWDVPEEMLDPDGFLATPGVYTLTGHLAGGAEFAYAVEVVDPAAIVSATDPARVQTTAGTAPVLPDSVNVTFADGSTGTASVTWDAIDSELYATAGSTFTVEGTVGESGLHVKVDVDVTEAPLVVTSIAPSEASCTVGTAPTLPETVTVTWSDGSTSDVAVTWDAIDASSYVQAGSFVVSGTIAEDAAARATCTVRVDAAPAVPVGLEAIEPVSTDAGVAPTLPATVGVTYSDGSVQQVAVTWDAVDESRYHNGGSFTVNGAVADTGLTATVTVNVADARVTGVQNNLAVQTSRGVAPKLPDTASVRWSNGDITTEKVTWNAVDASSYAQVGEFTVNGTVVGYTIPCKVTVLDQVAKTGDAVSPTLAVAGVVAAVGVAVVAAGVALAVRSRHSRG